MFSCAYPGSASIAALAGSEIEANRQVYPTVVDGSSVKLRPGGICEREFEQQSNEGRKEDFLETGRAGTPLPAGASDKNESLRVFASSLLKSLCVLCVLCGKKIFLVKNPCPSVVKMFVPSAPFCG
jgi:hypothetical protein